MSGTPVLSSLMACLKTVELFNNVERGNGPIVSVGMMEQVPLVLDAALEELVDVAMDVAVDELAVVLVFVNELPADEPPPQPTKPALIKLKMPRVPTAFRLFISTSGSICDELRCIITPRICCVRLIYAV